MGDTLEAGRERRPTPRWIPPVLTAVLAAGIGYAVVRSSDHGPSTPPSASPTTPGVSSPAAPDPVPAPWPSEPSACGATIDLPLLSVAPLDERTGLHVLVGGSGLRRVDIDTGRATRLHNATGRGTGKVTDLARAADGIHAVSMRCPEAGDFAKGHVFSVSRRAMAPVPGLGRTDLLLAAPDRTWVGRFDDDPDEPMVLYPVGDGSPVHLPVGFLPDAATSSEFLGATGNFDSTPTLVAVSREGSADIRRVRVGWFVAADDRFVLTYPDCDANGSTPCVLTRTGTDGSLKRYALPSGRQPVSGGILDSSGRFVAFLLTRPGPDPRYEVGHPMGPSDIAVLDLTSGHLTVVPGIELAPKTTAGLAFSRGGQWLVIALDEGTRTRLLVWRAGMDRARESPAQLPGKVLYHVPVLVTAG